MWQCCLNHTLWPRSSAERLATFSSSRVGLASASATRGQTRKGRETREATDGKARVALSRVLVTSGLRFFSRLANVRLLVAAREVRGLEASRTSEPEQPETMDIREDAVAGSEFVDDRIRVR